MMVAPLGWARATPCSTTINNSGSYAGLSKKFLSRKLIWLWWQMCTWDWVRSLFVQVVVLILLCSVSWVHLCLISQGVLKRGEEDDASHQHKRGEILFCLTFYGNQLCNTTFLFSSSIKLWVILIFIPNWAWLACKVQLEVGVYEDHLIAPLHSRNSLLLHPNHLLTFSMMRSMPLQELLFLESHNTSSI